MIKYNPKDWISFIFRFHRADTFRKLLPLMLAIGIYSALVAYIETEVWRITDSSHVKNLTITHNLLGFVISLLLVFRTNTAYDRWWEGRKLWGSLVNSSRNLAMKLNSMLTNQYDKSFFRNAIPAYSTALRKHLQSEKSNDEVFDGDSDFWKHLSKEHHVPNQIAAMMFAKIDQLYKNNQITGDQLIVLNAELSSFTDICGACERIKNTPIPFSYSTFIKKFIFIYVMSLPFGYVLSLGYLVVPVVIFIFYVLASLELIAEEIEEPFGTDANDLPMYKISHSIRKHVTELI